jgi:outer membrane protein assembly factor BamB
VLWTNRDVKFYSLHGLGSSPALVGDLLVMPFDGSSPGADKEVGWKKPWEGARIVAYDKKTGDIKWQAKRGRSRVSHCTPVVFREGGKDRLLIPAGDVIQAFDPETGELLWTVSSQGEGLVPSPVVGDGLIFASSGFEATTLRAVRPGGKGDVTRTHIAWEQKKGVPTQPSPVYYDGRLFTVTDNGVANCFEAKTGKLVWQQRLGGTFSASPVLASGKIYFLSEGGETTVVEPGPKYKEVARNSLGERCLASMAVSGGQLFIRTDRHLFCIGQASDGGK